MPKPLEMDSLIASGASKTALRFATMLIMEGDVDPSARVMLWSIVLGVSMDEVEAAITELKELGFVDESWMN